MSMTKEETPFRIGGVYRQQNGTVVKLALYDRPRPGWCFALSESADGCFHEAPWLGHGARDLLTGRYVHWRDDEDDMYALLPGELHQVNGEWVPLGVAQAAPKPAPSLGAVIRAQQVKADPLAANECLPAKERIRPPLSWADSKPTDRFDGYVVTSGSNDVLHTLCDGVHPLQRMTDPSDQLHGSAFLRKG